MSSPSGGYFESDIRRIEVGALVGLILAFVCCPVGLFSGIRTMFRCREFLTGLRGREITSEELVRVATARAMAVMAILASVVAPIVEFFLVVIVNKMP